MSKVVKSVTRAVSGVVKGGSKVVRSVAKGASGLIKKIASSKLGKILLVAATVYFGGAALMGGIQGAAAGSGFLGSVSGAVSGAATGIANAWSALGAATSSAMGGNFATAGSQLASGIQGAAPTLGAGSVAPVATGTTAGAAGSATTGASQYSLIPGAGGNEGLRLGASEMIKLNAGGAGTGAAGGGLLSGELAKYGMITGGMQLAGGTIQGIGQSQNLKDQRNYEQNLAAAQRDRIKQNMGETYTFGEPGESPMTTAIANQAVMPYQMDPNQPMARQYVPYRPAIANAMPGLLSGQMQTPQPGQPQHFSIYNPALAKYGYA